MLSDVSRAELTSALWAEPRRATLQNMSKKTTSGVSPELLRQNLEGKIYLSTLKYRGDKRDSLAALKFFKNGVNIFA